MYEPNGGLGFIPGVVAAATKASSIGAAVKGFTDGISGLFGDTPTDKARKARAAQLLQEALFGSKAALHQLLFDAYEKRSGLPGDTRTPTDGKYSPDAVRSLATKALKSYVNQVGGLPPEFASYASKLGTSALSPQSVNEAVALFPGAPLTSTAAPGTAGTLPSWVLPAALVGGGLLLFTLTSGKRGRR